MFMHSFKIVYFQKEKAHENLAKNIAGVWVSLIKYLFDKKNYLS